MENFFVVNKRDLLIGNGNFAHEVSTESGIGFNDLQISGNEQETVYRRRIALDLRVDNTRINIGQEGFALHKSVKFLVDGFIRFSKNLTDNIVATCGLPISTRLTIVAEVVDNRPGIKYLGITELISIVPRADLFVFIFCFIVLCHFLNFFGGKSKILAVFAVYNGVDGEVIKTAENAFLCYAENTREESVGEMFVILETAGEKVAHKADNFVVEPFDVSLLNRSVIFVYDDNGSDTVILVEHTGKICQRI